MTKQDLAQEVADELGERFSDLDIRETFLDWAQDTLDEVMTAGRWLQSNGTDSLSLVASTRTYALDADTSEVIAIVLTGGGLSAPKEVVQAAREALIRRGKDLSTATTGVPDYWYYTGVDASGVLQVAFQPVPDNSYTATLEVLQQPATPGDADEVPLPREFESVLKEGIRFRAYRNGGQTDLAAMSFQIYQSRLQLLNARYLGPFAGGSSLPIKTKMKTIDQAPAAADGT